jgi:hypothetical protein
MMINQLSGSREEETGLGEEFFWSRSCLWAAISHAQAHRPTNVGPNYPRLLGNAKRFD